MPSFNEWMFGSEDKLKKIQNGTPEQQQLHASILQQLQQMIGQGGGLQQANQYDQNLLGQGPEAFDQFSQPYLQQFNEKVIPGIEERYAGGGALSSSGFGQALGGASSGLQAQLAQLFSELQGQAANRQQGQFQNLSQQGLNYQPFSYQKKEGSSGMFGPLLSGLATAAGTALGGPAGGALAAALSQGVSSMFKPKQASGITNQTSGGGGGFGLPDFMQR